MLGREIGTVYNPNELKKLINIHVENPDAAVESGLTAQDQRLLTGALEYKDKQVLHVMTDLDKVKSSLVHHPLAWHACLQRNLTLLRCMAPPFS